MKLGKYLTKKAEKLAAKEVSFEDEVIIIYVNKDRISYTHVKPNDEDKQDELIAAVKAFIELEMK